MDKQQNSTNEVTLSVRKTYKYSLYLLIPVILIFTLPYFIIWGSELLNYWDKKIDLYKNGFLQYSIIYYISRYLFWIVVILILGAVVHEILHGLVWIFFTEKGLNSLSFGIMKPDMAPYIHCKEALPVNVYRIGILLPGVIMGLLPAVSGILTGNFKIFIFGVFFTWAASGDFIILWLTRHIKSPARVQDHPEKVGCLILNKK
jgi:hypothetical protein